MNLSAGIYDVTSYTRIPDEKNRNCILSKELNKDYSRIQRSFMVNTYFFVRIPSYTPVEMFITVLLYNQLFILLFVFYSFIFDKTIYTFMSPSYAFNDVIFWHT